MEYPETGLGVLEKSDIIDNSQQTSPIIAEYLANSDADGGEKGHFRALPRRDEGAPLCAGVDEYTIC